MDRAENIESQGYSAAWQERGSKHNNDVTEWLNRFGTLDPSRLPMRNINRPYFLSMQRVQPSLMKLNVAKARYHHPGGLGFRPADFADILHSRPKITAADNFVYSESKVNEGYFGHGY